jgi:glycosyltransferase involved in cell wall biosynthesis
MLSLYGSCDVFLSLHRSEGFGRGMAEALQLGVDVIASDCGGNTDFCIGLLSHPVRWRKAPIPWGSYPNADGHSWAEPDLVHAVQLCQQVAAQRIATTKKSNVARHCRDTSVLSCYREKFSFMQAALRYRRRLEKLLLKLDVGID